MPLLVNPFRPGAGHPPPYLAGRQTEEQSIRRVLRQDLILDNLLLTGLRGIGKTVLLDTVLRPLAVEAGWVAVGADLSESVSLTEENLVIRILADVATVSSVFDVPTAETSVVGFDDGPRRETKLDSQMLSRIYSGTPGLAVDKLKAALEYVWQAFEANTDVRGIVFAYDEAHNLMDRPSRDQYALALLLDTFYSLQRKGLPLMLVLTGLPTLFGQMVQSRTYSQRMFDIVNLQSLPPEASREAIMRPIQEAGAVRLSEESVQTIMEMSGGYPYFIQFICREVYDAFIQRVDRGEAASVPVAEITRKLDIGFFAGPWLRLTDRQRELLYVIAKLGKPEEFAVQEVIEASREVLERPFGASNVNQMLGTLGTAGLIFKNRHGRYSLALPLLGDFILREHGEAPL